MRLASALAVLVWSFLILPEMLELYALPPYLDEHEQKFVLEVLQRFPEGFCPEDEDIFGALPALDPETVSPPSLSPLSSLLSPLSSLLALQLCSPAVLGSRPALTAT